MELNNNKRVDSSQSRFSELQRGSEARNNELRDTVERVQSAASEIRERSESLGRRNDTIELSDAARKGVEAGDKARKEHIDGLRAAAADGSLFNHDRLARAAERLLTGE